MTSRQRILTTLAHQEPDRVPYDLGGIGPSGISLGAYGKVVSYLGLNEAPQVGDISSQRAEPSEDFLRKVGVDTRPLGYGAQSSWRLDLKEEKEATFFFDEWGIGRKMPKTKGHNYYIFSHPLAGVATENLSRYPWPDPTDPKRLDGAEQRAAAHRSQTDPALVFGGSLSQGFLQFAAQLEGYESFFMNLVLDPRRVEWLLDKLLELNLLSIPSPWSGCKAGWISSRRPMTWGHQHSQWLSPEMFRKFAKPRYARLFLPLKRRFGVKILFHSCGSVYPFIPDLIEMGADILNPLQLARPGWGYPENERSSAIPSFSGEGESMSSRPFPRPPRRKWKRKSKSESKTSPREEGLCLPPPRPFNPTLRPKTWPPCGGRCSVTVYTRPGEDEWEKGDRQFLKWFHGGGRVAAANNLSWLEAWASSPKTG